MLLPPSSKKATVSSAAHPVTFTSESYPVVIEETNYYAYDTAGLNEGQSLSSKAAKKTLESLLFQFSSQGMRIHLLVLCIRVPRITEVVAKNYKVFSQKICKGVPIVCIITGLENHEPDMESWWEQNREIFDRYGIKVHDHACITAIKGRRIRRNGQDRQVYQKEYEDSVKEVRQLIHRSASSLEEGWSFEMVSANIFCTSRLVTLNVYSSKDLENYGRR